MYEVYFSYNLKTPPNVLAKTFSNEAMAKKYVESRMNNDVIPLQPARWRIVYVPIKEFFDIKST